jgi:hypothetical protein
VGDGMTGPILVSSSPRNSALSIVRWICGANPMLENVMNMHRTADHLDVYKLNGPCNLLSMATHIINNVMHVEEELVDNM